MPQVSAFVSIGFIALVAILYSVLVIGVLYARNRAGDPSQFPVYIMRFCVGGFLLVTGLLALQGSFADMSAFPPRVAIAALVGFFGSVAFALSSRVGEWLRFLSQSWIVALQSFRFFVEMILFYLAKTPLMPAVMTFEGRNFDILIGATAPLIAYYVNKNKNAPSRTSALLYGWNTLGLLLLTQVVVTALLVRPIAVGQFPYVWLPAFLVPYAFLLHFLSLRKIKQQNEPTN